MTSASSSSAASEGGSSSFEFIEASTEGLTLPANAKEQEEGEEETAIAGAGSLGPKGEVEEVLREAKDELRRQKL